ncbi:MAG: helix-turn-helix domain-containing protein, partial [Patescibacteria group bacterium]
MYIHLTRDERAVISESLRGRESYAAIGSRIGKHKSTIAREVRRNANAEGTYHAGQADRRARQRRGAAKCGTRIIENNPALAAQIESRLEPLISPEVVGHALGIAPETIYAWIYRARPDLKSQLPQRGRKRRRYGSKREIKQGWTKDVRSLKERPPDRENWEGDTM